MLTYHDNVDRSSRLRAKCPELVPEGGIWREAKLNTSCLVKVGNDGNIVLHGWSEAGAFQSRPPDSLQKYVVEIDLVFIVRNTFNEELQHSLGNFMKLDTVFDSDMIYHVPWILLTVNRSKGSFSTRTYLDQGTDQTLK
jgi:hypothetical protein